MRDVQSTMGASDGCTESRLAFGSGCNGLNVVIVVYGNPLGWGTLRTDISDTHHGRAVIRCIGIMDYRVRVLQHAE